MYYYCLCPLESYYLSSPNSSRSSLLLYCGWGSENFLPLPALSIGSYQEGALNRGWKAREEEPILFLPVCLLFSQYPQQRLYALARQWVPASSIFFCHPQNHLTLPSLAILWELSS